MKAQIEKLLVLQDKDARLAWVKNSLAEIPLKNDGIKKDKAEADKELAQTIAALKALEKTREDMRTERRALEAKVLKYKTQLPETKKNEDYVALNNEIDRLSACAAEMEEKELGVMFEIDEGKIRIKDAEAAHAQKIAALNKKAEGIAAEKTELDGMLSAAIANSNAAREGIDTAYLSAYDRLKNGGKKFPIVVQLKGDECGGCHLKVSGETLSKLKNPTAAVLCEQCGRILYA